MTKQIEITNIKGIGFSPLVDFENFQIAILTFLDELRLENINYVEAHLLTDEVFLLLEGNCYLINPVVESEKIVDFHIINLEKGKLYNVKQNSFHHHVLSTDAKVLIVETKDTGYQNSKRIYFDDKAKELLNTTFKKVVGEDK